MANLRKEARGRECQVRIPGVCNHNPETSVLMHTRIAGLCGTGLKSPDLLAAIGCSSCHAAVDGQVKTEYSHDELVLMHLEGVMRTQAIWLKEKLVQV